MDGVARSRYDPITAFDVARKSSLPTNHDGTKNEKRRRSPKTIDKETERNRTTNIDSQDFRDAVTQATRLARQNGLIKYEDLPLPWRANLYIRTGYRLTPSILSTILSPICISNELVNIWTHLIPMFLVLRYPLYLTPPFKTFQEGGLGHRADALVAITYCAAAVLSLGCSTAWHTFRCNSRLRVMAAFVCVDIMSVSLILTAFNILVSHTLFYTQPQLHDAYITSSLVWCLAGIILPWTNLFRPINVAPLVIPGTANWPLTRGWNRVIFFCSLGAQGQFIPALHSGLTNGWEYTSEIFLNAVPVVAPIFLGSVVYGSKIPERLWPGRFDYFGCSHNIWHVASAISALAGCKVMLDMFEVAWIHAS